jgi:hypothetical protein
VSHSLPPELARRIEALEVLEALDEPPIAPDFDPVSWMWLAVLGLVVPIALLVLGWWLP